MGRKGDGVEIRSKSIRLSFTIDGKAQRHTLMLNGKPMSPTQANLKHAHRVAAEIRDKIRVGIFSIAEYFPVSGAGGARTVGDHLDAWLGTKRIESSSRAGYESAIKFWKTAPRDNSGRAINDIVLRTLRRSHLLHGIASRPALSGKTVNNYVSVMRDALDLALASLSEILCVRHNMLQRSMYAEQEQQEEGGGRIAVDSERSA